MEEVVRGMPALNVYGGRRPNKVAPPMKMSMADCGGTGHQLRSPRMRAIRRAVIFHPEQHRGLSIREAALLQGFPRNYGFAGSFDSQFRQIGNAVPPTFSTFLAAHLYGELVQDPPATCDEPDIVKSIGPSFSRLIPALKAGYRRLPSGGTSDLAVRAA